jgi:hypothetical protein
MAHRRAHGARYADAAASPLERLKSVAVVAGARMFTARSNEALPQAEDNEPRRFNLGARLPINLRNFLSEQMGPSVRVEEDSIVALEPRSSDLMMRELARAIRRFSAARAREAWSECAVSSDRLHREFFAAAPDVRAPVVLCLRCGCLGTGAMDQHSGERCIRVDLGAEVRADELVGRTGALRPASDALHRAIETFRRERTAAAMPHYDVDCFTAGGQVIFTWRPVS